MFAAGQEWCFLLFCLLSAEEVWNANFTKAGGRKGKDDEKEKEYVPFNKRRRAHREEQKKEREWKVVGSGQTDEEKRNTGRKTTPDSSLEVFIDLPAH